MGRYFEKCISPILLAGLCLTTGCADSARDADRASLRNGESESDNDDGAISSALWAELEADSTAVQRVLLDPANQDIRDTSAFRKAIRVAAIKHKISSLTIAPESEPGEWLEIEGTVVGPDESPIPDALVNVFGTDANGYYHPTIEGESVPRLFGVLVTDKDGKFAFRTIRPGPYPGTRNAEHFHIWASVPGMRMAAPHYSVLDDDPLLFEPQNGEQRGEAIRIKMEEPGEDGVAHGTIVLPMR